MWAQDHLASDSDFQESSRYIARLCTPPHKKTTKKVKEGSQKMWPNCGGFYRKKDVRIGQVIITANEYKITDEEL